MSLISAENAENDRLGIAGRGPNVSPLDHAVKCRAASSPASGCGDWTDQQLVFAASESRDAAFAELFRRHSASVAAVARMFLGAANSGCDDVVAEVFAALWWAPERFDPDRGSLLGFLRVRARGRSIDLLRSESRRHRRERNNESNGTMHSAIDAQLIAAETRQDLLQAVSRLPETERAPIELAYFASMSYRAVACQLDLPEGTVKSRIRSGLQHLRAQVGREDCGTMNSSPPQTDATTLRDPGRGILG